MDRLTLPIRLHRHRQKGERAREAENPTRRRHGRRLRVALLASTSLPPRLHVLNTSPPRRPRPSASAASLRQIQPPAPAALASTSCSSVPALTSLLHDGRSHLVDARTRLDK
jgi:hypothetical protein